MGMLSFLKAMTWSARGKSVRRDVDRRTGTAMGKDAGSGPQPIRSGRFLSRLVGLVVVGLVSWSSSVGAAGFDHSAWDTLLKKYVDANGRVAYRRMKTDDRPLLASYLEQLSTARPEELGQKESLAFWINAYNAMIVHAVLDGYSAENSLKRYSLFKRYRLRLAGEERTPDAVEHEIVRPQYHDFRTHFALVCASSSCPKLRREAYRGDVLDRQLDDQAREFLADNARNRFEASASHAALSQIFQWFHEDFEGGGKSLADRLAPYLASDQVKLLKQAAPKFIDYDWTMNAQEGERP